MFRILRNKTILYGWWRPRAKYILTGSWDMIYVPYDDHITPSFQLNLQDIDNKVEIFFWLTACVTVRYVGVTLFAICNKGITEHTVYTHFLASQYRELSLKFLSHQINKSDPVFKSTCRLITGCLISPTSTLATKICANAKPGHSRWPIFMDTHYWADVHSRGSCSVQTMLPVNMYSTGWKNYSIWS